MKNILIIPNINKDKDYKVSTLVAKRLSRLGLCVYIQGKYNSDLSGYASITSEIKEHTELIIVVGGDGSVIDASTYAVELDIPVLGINLGNLGYLAELEPDSLDMLSLLVTGEYRIEEKMLLSATVDSGEGEIVSSRLALNDVIISHETYVGLAELSLTDSHGESVKYRADGLILSTPVGSTAYSLSAGGPVVSHDIDSITATPICPHSFFNRSIIFNSSECLKISNNGKDNLNVTIDGRYFCELKAGGVCCVSLAGKRFKMLTFSGNNMFSTLFGKMKRFENI